MRFKDVLREYLKYDPVTGKFLWIKAPKYHADLLGKEAGCATSSKNGKLYWKIKFNGRPYKRAVLAWVYQTGSFPKHIVDHKSRDPLDDSWNNLRDASTCQNMQNHGPHKKKSPYPPGVRKISSIGYDARVTAFGKVYHLGTFPSPDSAYSAYVEAKRKLHGEFSGLSL